MASEGAIFTSVKVTKPEHLEGLAGLIVPGGESTVIASVAERTGLTSALRDAITERGLPTWVRFSL